MVIWTLTENTVCRDDLQAEHGLSLYIETEDCKILFDAGQTGAFAKNARKLGVDLSKVDVAVLSHGHYDHGGGLLRFLELNTHAKIFVNQNAFGTYCNAEGRYIGLDPALLKTGRIVPVGDTFSLGGGITLHACNGCARPFPTDSFGQTVLENGLLQPDDFAHEQYLAIREGGKTVLFSGCSHKGVLNIVHWFRPDVLVGGFHMMKLPPDSPELIAQAQELGQYPTVYYTGHCTGLAQYAAMKRILGDRLEYLSAGTVITV